MERRFKNVSYDLAQNIMYEEKDQPKSLKYYSLIFLIADCLKRNRDVRKSYIMNLFFQNYALIKSSSEPFHNSEIANEMAQQITEFCILPIFLSKSFDFNKHRKFVNETIFFVVVQIWDMIGKNIISTDDIRDAILILNNLEFTCQGTINIRKTVVRILNRSNETDFTQYDKCVLACYYFIEEAVVSSNSKRVPTQRFEKYFNSRSRDKAMNLFFKFWKWFIDKNREDVQKVTKGYQTYINKMEFPDLNEGESIELSNIFKQAVLSNNENAVQYLWINYISGMSNKVQILEKVLTLAIPHKNNTNIIMFLIFQINNNELEDFFKSNYFTIIQNIVKNIRWHPLFPKIFYELKFYFYADDFLKLLTDLTHTYFIDHFTFVELTLYFINLFPDYFKHLLTNKPDDIYNKLFTKPLLYAKEDIVRTLLKIINEVELKNFLCSNSGINLLAESIKNGKLNFHDKILPEFLTRDTILKIKRNLFFGKKEILSKYFMQILQFENLCYLVDWLSDAVPDYISEFKASLAHYAGRFCFRKIFFRTDIQLNYNPISSATEFLFWCFRSEESISTFKQILILCHSQTYTGEIEPILCYDDLKTLMLESKWERIKMFLNWRGYSFEEKMALLEDLLKDNEFYSRIISKTINEELSLITLLLFLQKNLYLDAQDFNIFRRKFFEVMLKEEPVILTNLNSRYGHKISEEHFFTFIKEDQYLNKIYGILNTMTFDEISI
ncbi:UNVERIFIED_CONTAM: hypothetical protein RMT77_018625 [Armadillidium vulgare]